MMVLLLFFHILRLIRFYDLLFKLLTLFLFVKRTMKMPVKKSCIIIILLPSGLFYFQVQHTENNINSIVPFIVSVLFVILKAQEPKLRQRSSNHNII